jgi:hypothetical protein
MQDKPRGADSEGAPTTTEQDLRDQAAVLMHVLDLYPQTLTRLELLKEMTGGMAATFDERDRHHRAVRDLAAGGLLTVGGALVVPTRAAVLFHELAEL